MIDLNELYEPLLIKGGYFVDDRGSLSFVNDFNPSQFKRFYMVQNHTAGFIRAWHGHKIECKGVLAISGSALIGTASMDSGEKCSTTVLTAESPSILLIPKGYANGFKSLTDDCKLMFFSSTTIEESKDDDYRYDYDHWNPWGENYR